MGPSLSYTTEQTPSFTRNVPVIVGWPGPQDEHIKEYAEQSPSALQTPRGADSDQTAQDDDPAVNAVESLSKALHDI